MTLLLALLRVAAIAFAVGAATVAILGFLGFAVAELDLLNHLQPFIFTAAIVGLILAILVLGDGQWRLAVVAYAATGFILSATLVAPEVVSGLLPRAPLPADSRPVLKAMTFNIFGLNYEMARVRDYIFAEDPDIIAFQEYFPEQREPLHPMIVERYPHFAHCLGGKRANIGLYSKLPFTQTDTGACNEEETVQVRTARILASFMLPDGTQFSVMTTHLDWPLPIARQEAEIADLVAAVNRVRGPLLLMGDFNSTPWSYALRGLAADTATTRHTRNLVTYPLAFTLPRFSARSDGLVPLVPFLPLDHVFSRGGVAVHELAAGPDVNSDHYPVVFRFSVAPATECCRAE